MNDNHATLLETGWRAILQDQNGFCCDHHREMYRAIYFAGAMNAMAAATTWHPGIDRAEIRPACMHMVCDELSLESFNAERRADGAGHA